MSVSMSLFIVSTTAISNITSNVHEWKDVLDRRFTTNILVCRLFKAKQQTRPAILCLGA